MQTTAVEIRVAAVVMAAAIPVEATMAVMVVAAEAEAILEMVLMQASFTDSNQLAVRQVVALSREWFQAINTFNSITMATALKFN